MGLPCSDSGKHSLAASRAFRHRPAELDLRSGLAPEDRERQRDQAVSSARRTKDLQDGPMVPRTHTFHVSVRKPLAATPAALSGRFARSLREMPLCGQTARGAHGTVAALCSLVRLRFPLPYTAVLPRISPGRRCRGGVSPSDGDVLEVRSTRGRECHRASAAAQVPLIAASASRTSGSAQAHTRPAGPIRAPDDPRTPGPW